jgi:hypothetical protein
MSELKTSGDKKKMMKCVEYEMIHDSPEFTQQFFG